MIDDKELLFVVDENNNPLKPKSRNETHASNFWHRVSHIWIFNSKKQILCQERSKLKDVNPGKWEAHFGGHVRFQEDYIDNAIIETIEELGLERKESEMIFFKVNKNDQDKEFQGIFYTFWDGDIDELKLEEEEVIQVEWVDIEKLKDVFNVKDPLWVHHNYEVELLRDIKNN